MCLVENEGHLSVRLWVWEEVLGSG
jgi:hypothetical protein